MSSARVNGSFRDPSGVVFSWDGIVLRQVNRCYQGEYDHLMRSGLYQRLTDEKLMLLHKECGGPAHDKRIAYKILQPEQLAFVSYPYEWSFSQLKDAALLTLRLQREAMSKGMSLKDASAYNVQFHSGRPAFIDTLSFEFYDESVPWVAYRQFCQHFLAPLALMSFKDVGLGQLLRVHLDGVPLPLASKLLPLRTRWDVGLGLHIHLHARSQLKYADQPEAAERQRKGGGYSRRHLENLIASLEATVGKLQWRGGDTEWADYYQRNNNYSAEGMSAKEQLVRELLGRIRPQTVWDLGANTGRFSRIAATGARTVVSWDIDPSCVEANYRQVRQQQDAVVVPLLLDLSNPSPSLGWAHSERPSLLDRGPADNVLALGLIHHLAISNNVPLGDIAAFLARAGRRALIEWVPKEDSQVQRLLRSRKDIFADYTQSDFERTFSNSFAIQACRPVAGTCRVLYLMTALNDEKAPASNTSASLGDCADPLALG